MADTDYSTEEWRVIEEAPDYAVSSLGNVKRVTRGGSTNPKMGIGAPLVPYISHGYRIVNIRIDGKRYPKRVNRLVCAAFHGPAPDGKPFAAHWDDVRSNDRVENLRWASQVDNMGDMYRNGHGKRGDAHWTRLKPSRVACGERTGKAKITADIAAIIRASDGTHAAIGASYGVSRRLVGRIKAGQRWAHLPPPQ